MRKTLAVALAAGALSAAVITLAGVADSAGGTGRSAVVVSGGESYTDSGEMDHTTPPPRPWPSSPAPSR